jgi:hypothetical protein
MFFAEVVMRASIPFILLFLLCAVPAGADEKFEVMDTDRNGRVDWEEFRAAYPNLKQKAFDTVDTDADNGISHEEWDAFRGAHAGAKQSAMPLKPLPNPQASPDLPLIRPPK